jgi:hypothetical protein
VRVSRKARCLHSGLEFLSRNTVFENLFAFKELGRATAVVEGNAEPVNCFLVSGSFFRGLEVHQTLRVTPAMAAGATNRLWSIADLVSLLP